MIIKIIGHYFDSLLPTNYLIVRCGSTRNFLEKCECTQSNTETDIAASLHQNVVIVLPSLW